MDEDDRTAVRAVVHARLLGIRLLTIDAQVLVGPAWSTPSPNGALYPVERLAEANGSARVIADVPEPSRRALTPGGRTPGLKAASELLAASEAALHRNRRSSHPG